MATNRCEKTLRGTVCMFRIKICGITNTSDAMTAANAGADALGLNFYPKSPRYVLTETAQEIVRALPAVVVKVGLFVNSPAIDVCRIFDELRLDLIQLHGDEPPGFLTELGGRPVMRAFRIGAEGIRQVSAFLGECRRLGPVPRLILLDSCTAGQYGGTGLVGNWSAVRQYPAEPWYPPMVLAGGLTPENVAQAITQVRPMAVDTASGVEVSPRRKSADLVRHFVESARAAFEG